MIAPRRGRARAWTLALTAAALAALASPQARAQAPDQAPDQAPAEGSGQTGPAHSAAAILRDAGDALDRGEHQRAADLARGVTANAQVPAPDRAEAWRLYGLASFFLERFVQAEQAFLEHLKLEVDGRLDPALVPPEALVFFEDVRARHAAELRAYRPAPEPRRYRALNLLPPAGQFQNGHRAKGWIIGGLGGLALLSNLGSYVILQRWCDAGTGVCRSGGESRAGASETLRAVNVASGVVLIGVIAYGMYDGFRHFRPSRPGVPKTSLRIVPAPDGGFVSVTLRY